MTDADKSKWLNECLVALSSIITQSERLEANNPSIARIVADIRVTAKRALTQNPKATA